MTTRRQVTVGLLGALGWSGAAAAASRRRTPVLHADGFRNGLGQWVAELEKGGRIEARRGVLDIDVPGGATLWFRQALTAPLAIEYQARAVSAGGPNDRVSDLNCFWMANDARAGADFFARPRSGAFADYDRLTTYYVGMGGNSNTTTRFRRYVGRAAERPIRPQDDLSQRSELIEANRWYALRLVADAHGAAYWRDGRKVFDYRDALPYRRGWFGLRTTQNHMQVRAFRILQLTP